MPRSKESVSDAGLDLLLGGSCVGCGTPGRVLCPPCDASLPRHGGPAWPTPVPAGLVLPYAAGPYDGLLKAMVNQHKEDGVLALATPLGRVLSDVVRDLLIDLGAGGGPVVLVPVPSHRAVVRRRGHDPLLRTSRQAAVRLRRMGVDVGVRRLLTPTGRVHDQSTLNAAQRAANLSGSMCCRRARGLHPGACVLVLDDVVTTGSTLREAQRALESGGVQVRGAATVAATRRRLRSTPESEFDQ